MFCNKHLLGLTTPSGKWKVFCEACEPQVKDKMFLFDLVDRVEELNKGLKVVQESIKEVRTEIDKQLKPQTN